MKSSQRNILLILLILWSIPLAAQHNIIYRFNHIHQEMINPATAGSEFIPVAALTYQKQWLGINHSPSTLLASTSLRIGNYDFYNPKMMINKSSLKTQERIGLGIGLYADQNGPVASRGINMAYAYHLNFPGSSLALGLAGTMEQTVLNGTSWDPITAGDPLLNAGKESYYNFNANLGVFFSGAEYFAGFAVTHILPIDNKLDPGEKVKQDYVLHGGYLFWSMQNLKFEPSVNLRYLDYEILQYDIRAKLYLQHVHWIALTYRSYKALALSAGLKIKRFYIAYQFEANLSSMISYSAGTQGVSIGMNLGMRGLGGF